MTYNISEELEKDSLSASRVANYFNIEPGNANVCRVLTRGKEVKKHFLGKGNPKPVCYGYDEGCPVRKRDEETGEFTSQHGDTFNQYILYVLDRSDGAAKLAFFPRAVMIAIGQLQQNPDYAFADMPMPYDIRITWSPDEKDPKNKYRVEVKPNSPELTKENLANLEERMVDITPEQMRDKMTNKQKENDEKSGRRKTKLELDEEQRDYLKHAVEEEGKKQDAIYEGSTVQYPESIHPEDIPF